MVHQPASDSADRLESLFAQAVELEDRSGSDFLDADPGVQPLVEDTQRSLDRLIEMGVREFPTKLIDPSRTT